VKKRKAVAAPLPALPSAFLHHRWTLALVVQGLRNEAVRRHLERDDLPSPADSELDEMRAAHPLPKGFKPHDEKHSASVAFLEKLGLAALFRARIEVEQAFALLRRHRSREAVEAATIAGVPIVVIAQLLKLHVHHEVTVHGIEAYRKFFFDTHTVNRSQLRVLVEGRVRLAVQRAVASGDDTAAARRAVAADARIQACALSSSPIALCGVLLALGYSPGRPEIGELLRQMETLSAIRTGEALLRGEPDDERRAASYAGVLRAVEEIKGMVSVPDVELQRKLQTLALRTNNAPLLTVDELRARGEGVTVDTMPLYEREADLSATDDLEGEHGPVS
jgi:hypothetical protein